MNVEDYKPLTPVSVERKLREIGNDLTRAQLALAAAREPQIYPAVMPV